MQVKYSILIRFLRWQQTAINNEIFLKDIFKTYQEFFQDLKFGRWGVLSLYRQVKKSLEMQIKLDVKSISNY